MDSPTRPSPTVVLVHGAFADASSWSGVIRELLSVDVKVVAPANPLRALASDAAYVASVVRAVRGPVLLVGHSYGGAVITAAAGAADNVVGLVYVAALTLEEGESAADVLSRFPETQLGPAL